MSLSALAVRIRPAPLIFVWRPLCDCGAQGGGNPFGNMGAMMENIKKAQAVVQVPPPPPARAARGFSLWGVRGCKAGVGDQLRMRWSGER